MEPKFQTSFIPKKPIGSPQGSGIAVVRTTNLFSVTATVVFIVTILTSVGLFFYKNILVSQVDQANQNIVAARAAFEPDTIKKLIDVNNRIVSAKKLLNNHMVVSKILTLMQDLTVKKMRLTQFDYSVKNNLPTISAVAEVQTYNALAAQQNIFLQNSNIQNPAFSDFNLGDNGYVVVNFSANIDPNFVLYKNIVNATPLN